MTCGPTWGGRPPARRCPRREGRISSGLSAGTVRHRQPARLGQRSGVMGTSDEVLRGVLQAEIEVAACITQRDVAGLSTADAVDALREFGRRCSKGAPLVEAQISIPEPELQHIVATLCERYGAGLHKKPRQRLLTITAPREFIDRALQPIVQGMLDVVIASRHEQVRRLIAELRGSAPEEAKQPS